MTIQLLIGNKNHSSWSLRAWLALRHTGIAFEETVIELYVPGAKEKILAWSPMGKVPTIKDGDLHVWDSLSVLEYLAETFPDKQLWPADKAARAHARSVSAEMHSSFGAIRREMPMDVRATRPGLPMSQDCLADAARIEGIWTDCLKRYGGPFLFGGGFTVADAMYAPIAYRFRTYGHDPKGAAADYMRHMLALPAMQEWEQAALKEPWVSERLERRA